MIMSLRTVLHRIGRAIQRPLFRISKTLSRKNLNRFLEQRLSDIHTGAVVLNVGAGGAIEDLLRARAKKRGFSVSSLDIDPNRKPDIVGDITRLTLPPASIDVVVMMEVLEHVTDPAGAIAGVFNVLRPGGHIIFSAPFIFPLHDRPHDHFRFTRYGLQSLFSKFEDVSITARNNWAEAINVLVGRLLVERHWTCRLAAPFAVLWAALMMPLAWMIGTLIKTDCMTTGYVLSGRKPVK